MRVAATPIIITITILAVLLGSSFADKQTLTRFMQPPPRQDHQLNQQQQQRGLTITTANGSVVISDGDVWTNYAMAEPAWATLSSVSFALGGNGNFALKDWGGIAEYACQGSLIAEKLLSFGASAERGLVASWLYTMPISPAGACWEAQNSQWHVAKQGAWESSAEALIMLKLGVAHGAISAAAFSLAPERLLCVSRDNGHTFTLAGQNLPGLTDADCVGSPAQLLAQFPVGSRNASQPALFADTPSASFPGPSESLDNAGRILTEALTLPLVEGPVTHIALPLIPRASGPRAWPANVSVFDVASGALLAQAALPAHGADPAQWFVLRAPLSPGCTILVVLAAQESESGAADSWFLGPSWVTNANPGGGGGGASQATFGRSPEWLRNTSAPPNDPRLSAASVRTSDDAVSLELRRVRASAGMPLGVSLAQVATTLLAWCLALCSQVPAAVVAYDVFVIPDPLFRGSLEDGVNSGCSYYDLLRLGFASSYINLRVLEAVEAYVELQNCGLVPSTCAADAYGVDNAQALTNGSTPCYTNASMTTILGDIRAAIATRFFSTANGSFVDWLGCAAMGHNNRNVSACGLQYVHDGNVPADSPLNVASTTFLPSLALAAKLQVGGAATQSAFVSARDRARQGPVYGPGWFHTALQGLEDLNGGARATIAQATWALVDAQGFAVHDQRETGDWHMYNPAAVHSTGVRGYGQFEAQAENGGRFFSTTALVWDTGSVYPELFGDWARMVNNLQSVGSQIARNDTSTPLLPADRAFLSSPTAADRSGVVFALCAKARASFPNVTDRWGQRLCDYYQDVAWALPENGVVLFSAVKALLGVRVFSNASLGLLGDTRRISAGMQPWTVEVPIPVEFPADVGRAQVWGLVVGATTVDIDCAVSAGKSIACVCQGN